jgi:hypothetical protein
MEHIRITTEKLIGNWQKKRCTQRDRNLSNGLSKILTSQEQKHVTYQSLEDSRIVTLGVDSSAWLYTLNIKKRQLLKSLNKILGPKEEVSVLFFKLDAT